MHRHRKSAASFHSLLLCNTCDYISQGSASPTSAFRDHFNPASPKESLETLVCVSGTIFLRHIHEISVPRVAHTDNTEGVEDSAGLAVRQEPDSEGASQVRIHLSPSLSRAKRSFEQSERYLPRMDRAAPPIMSQTSPTLTAPVSESAYCINTDRKYL